MYFPPPLGANNDNNNSPTYDSAFICSTYLRCPPRHSQPERRIAAARQEEANPMKTVASVLTLCGQRTWGTARQAFFKKQNKKKQKNKTKKEKHTQNVLVQKKKMPRLFFFFFFLLRVGGKKGGSRCVACSLRELFILRVPSLWRSERRQPHSSYSALPAADTTLKGTRLHSAAAAAARARTHTLLIIIIMMIIIIVQHYISTTTTTTTKNINKCI